MHEDLILANLQLRDTASSLESEEKDSFLTFALGMLQLLPGDS